MRCINVIPDIQDLIYEMRRDEYDNLIDMLTNTGFLQAFVELACREEEVIKWMLHDIHG